MNACEKLIVGNQYSRADIYKVLAVPVSQRRGNWETGYNQYNGEYFVFVNVKTPGRTGHNYNDAWQADGTLFWHGKLNSHIHQPGIKKMLDPSTKCHFFTRDNNKNVLFTYQGVGKVVSYLDVSPVEVYWIFPEYDHDPIASNDTRNTQLSKHITRSQRVSCINHYGDKCWVCGFDFVEIYGVIGDGHIRVCHNNPTNTGTIVDPIAQLRPICPNCAALFCRRTNDMQTIDDFREYYRRRK